PARPHWPATARCTPTTSAPYPPPRPVPTASPVSNAVQGPIPPVGLVLACMTASPVANPGASGITAARARPYSCPPIYLAIRQQARVGGGVALEASPGETLRLPLPWQGTRSPPHALPLRSPLPDPELHVLQALRCRFPCCADPVPRQPGR